MTGPIVTGLDAALAAWDDARAEREARSRAAFKGHRRRVLVDPDAHPLARTRMGWHGIGMTQETLSERSTVSLSTIRAAEAGEQVSDATWNRLCLGLGGVRRERIDPGYIR